MSRGGTGFDEKGGDHKSKMRDLLSFYKTHVKIEIERHRLLLSGFRGVGPFTFLGPHIAEEKVS